MKLSPKRRQCMIDALVEDNKQSLQDSMPKDYNNWLTDILLTGFTGYSNYTDQELIEACESAEIVLPKK